MCCKNDLKLLLVCLCLLSGCAGLPTDSLRAKQLAMPSFKQTLTTDQTEQMLTEWPKAQWWLALNNPELNRLMDTALQDNPGLHAATARLTQAEALADFQAAEMMPMLNSNLEFHQRRFSSTDFYGPNGGKTFTGAYLDFAVLRYHLDLWGKDKAVLAAALGQQRAQASELAMAKLILSTAIARSYISLCVATEDLELAQVLNEKTAETLQLTKLRWQRGLNAQDPVFAAEQQAAAAQQRETTAHHKVQLLRNRLAALAGKGPDWGKTIQVQASELAAQLPPPEMLALGLLAHRPDVAAALWRVEAAAQMVHVAKTRFYPDVNLTGFAGLRSLRLDDLFLSHGASVAYGLAPSINLPIFEGGRLEAELKHQQSDYDAAVESYNQTLLNAVQQVADSLAEWRQSRAHDAEQAQALAAAEAESRLAGKRYQAGISSRDATIEADAALIKQRLTASEMHGAQLLAVVGLIEALGGGYQNDMNKGEQP